MPAISPPMVTPATRSVPTARTFLVSVGGAGGEALYIDISHGGGGASHQGGLGGGEGGGRVGGGCGEGGGGEGGGGMGGGGDGGGGGGDGGTGGDAGGGSGGKAAGEMVTPSCVALTLKRPPMLLATLGAVKLVESACASSRPPS